MCLFGIPASAQKPVLKKYPSLFWEITGNGLNKPSYLFGTMHVSNKMVFHLSDSFYYALKNVDVVALELNPEKWQSDMFKMQQAQSNLAKFNVSEVDDYINEQSFQILPYEENLRRALSEEPTVANSLLYRNFQAKADFEENTYLDLYIYQTGKKLGKAGMGVEDYEETEQLMMEAYQDMAREKTRRTINTNGESMFDLDKKMQEAYRKGDLDMMDSLEVISITSPAFTEKFLYKRNEIQAHSIDTILQKNSLFVGVGAAHLPGPRGVIEILRNKGYKLRPIFMQDRDAVQKDVVDKLKVPVVFKNSTSEDGLITMQLPGTLHKREEARGNDSWQYADMNNGSYYMVTRVKSHAALSGDDERIVLKKLDSLLYENIPGRIIRKVSISKNGFKGFDVTSKTRRGDIQRYNIFVTPHEVLVFKISGNDVYVEGDEANIFFNSIKIKEPQVTDRWQQFEPKQGGFSVKFPQHPNESLNKNTSDKIDRWEYEVVDEKTKDAYFVWKKTVNNFNFLEEDTFDLNLIEESLSKSTIIEKQLSRKLAHMSGSPYLDMKYALKDGQILRARAYIKGPHYYLVAARSANKMNHFEWFFNSFKFTNYQYPEPGIYIDTILKLEVNTPVQPILDQKLRSALQKNANEDFINGPQASYNYWPKSKNGLFKSDATGEAIWVSVDTYPKYYYSKDTAKFWKDKIEDKLRKDMYLQRRTPIIFNNAVLGYDLKYTDTNSSRTILVKYLLKNNLLFKLVTLTDTLQQSSFLTTFFSNAKPLENSDDNSIFDSKLQLFFADFYSADTLIKSKAYTAIPNMYFGKLGVGQLVDALNSLNIASKDYFETKTRIIAELGYIDDTTIAPKIVSHLQNIYKQSVDTSVFQNAVINALARLKTKESYAALKEMFLADPPVFDNTYDYARLFANLTDSLVLAKTLFPEILQLAQLDDYRPKLNSLLRVLVDSGYVTGNDYKDYFNKLFFDAKVQLKKQQIKDGRIMERQIKNEEEDRTTTRNYNIPNAPVSLSDYMVLLMPFYDKNVAVQGFYNKLLQSKDMAVQLDVLPIMIKNRKSVDDSILLSLAEKDAYRVKLFRQLEKINRQDLFPAKFKNQEAIARSMLVSSRGYDRLANIELVARKYVEHKAEKGYVYFFKYKMKSDEDWLIGIGGLQPNQVKNISSKDILVKMTGKKLRTNEPIIFQFETQLKRLIFETHKSSRQFYTTTGFRSFLPSF